MKRGNKLLLWFGYLFWALFVNACNVWIVKPLVLDFSILGVVAVVLLVVLWLTSIPKLYRKKWIVFSLFSLLLGDGISELTVKPPISAILLGVLMIFGLVALAWLFARVRIRLLAGASVLLVLVNLALPVDDWSFLTHFWVAYHTTLPMQASDMSAPPLSVIQSGAGTSVVSLTKLNENDKQLQQIAQTSGDTNDSLENLLRNYGHRYGFVALTQKNGHFHMQQLPEADLGAIDPLQFDNNFFPFMQAFWSEQGNQVVQYMAPAQSPLTIADIVNQSGNFPANLNALGNESHRQEMADWQRILGNLGISEQPRLTVKNGHLVGSYRGGTVDIAVDGKAVLGSGSFTAPGSHEVLVGGANLLQVVSLDGQAIVTTYHGSAQNMLPNDIVVGPLNNSGRDSIFVNASPAFIIQANASGAWTTLYTAPDASSLRFEAAIRFQGDQTPEIITNDPSVMRESPVRYLTSYTYRAGQLYRNWRVYRSNAVNLQPVQFSPTGPKYLVMATYQSGKIFVLRRHDLPVLPTTIGLLGLIVIAGWVWRMRRKGVSSHV